MTDIQYESCFQLFGKKHSEGKNDLSVILKVWVGNVFNINQDRNFLWTTQRNQQTAYTPFVNKTSLQVLSFFNQNAKRAIFPKWPTELNLISCQPLISEHFFERGEDRGDMCRSLPKHAINILWFHTGSVTQLVFRQTYVVKGD